MKYIFKYLTVFVFVFVYFFGFNFYSKFINLNSVYVVYAEEDDEGDDDEGDDDEGDDDEGGSSSSQKSNVQVAPVKSVTPMVAPMVAPVPQMATPLMQTSPTSNNEKVTSTRPAISESLIKENLKSNEDFGRNIKDVSLTTETTPEGDVILTGQVNTTQKIFGLFEIEIPLDIKIASDTGKILEIKRSSWVSFLDFISF